LKIDKKVAQRIISLIDLTSLSGTETPSDIIQLCENASSPYGDTAAVCVCPKYVQTAKAFMASKKILNIKIATVVNFPSGQASIEKVTADTRLAIKHGADEIDIVLPYQDLMAGNIDSVEAMLHACKQACNNKVALKVIIESGELDSPENVTKACELSLEYAADFIKTSTGKVSVNATHEAAKLILESIKQSNDRNVGIKVSGGVKTIEQAADYLAIAQSIMGDEWIHKGHFRFGASSLLNNLVKYIQKTSQHPSETL